MDKEIENAIKRARGYWFVDGFTELALGGLLSLLAGFLLLSLRSSQAPFPTWILSVTGEITILKIVSFLIVIIILLWLKDHFTYPRTGFVRGKITANQIIGFIKNVILLLLFPVVGLLIISVFITSAGRVLSSMPVWFPVGLAFLWAILIVLTGEWLGLVRFRWVGGMILLAGISVGIWQLTMGLPGIPTNIQPELLQPPVLESIKHSLMGLGFILLLSGIVFIFSGAFTFIRYRKENPRPYTEDA